MPASATPPLLSLADAEPCGPTSETSAHFALSRYSGDHGPAGRFWRVYVSVWLPWSAWLSDARTPLPGRPALRLPLVLDLTVFGVGLEEARRQRHVCAPSAVTILGAALTRYGEMAAAFSRGVPAVA